jgi:hypothetical protein
MNIRPLARRALKFAPIVLLAALALGGSVAAATPNAIEGVWSFSGGAVAVEQLPNGAFQGTVVKPTTFAQCVHPAGQVMWTDMQPQADGSFWGLHQWYHGPECEADPVLGHTAWRVLQSSSRARILKVCFDTPSSQTQPTIAPNGASAHVTYKCTESSPLAPLPTVSTEGSGSGTVTFGKTVVLPAAKGCVSQTSLKIKLHDPRYDPLKEIVVRIDGKRVADIRGAKQLKKALKKGIILKKLPGGTYKVSVLAITVLKQRLSGSRTYHSCKKGPGKIKLHHGKHHHHG